MVTAVKDVREGYKMTELGEIPEEWEVKNLIDLSAKILDGVHATPKYTNVGVKFLSVENVTQNNFDSTKYISQEDHNNYSKRCFLEKNDILMTRIGTIGVPKLVDWEFEASIYVSLAQIKLKSKDQAQFITQYMMSSIFKAETLKRSLLSATPQKINLGDIGKIPIILPPIHEQQKIAEILSTVDETIEMTIQLLEKTKELKKGLMQQLLTKGIGHTEFKMTELGEIPVEWELSPLNEVTEYVDYRGKTPKKSESGIFLVTAKNIKKGFIDYSISKEFVSEETYEVAMKRGTPKLGEVLFTTEAPLGNVAQVTNENVALAQRVIKFNFKGSSLNKFLMYYMLGDVFQKNLNNKSTGTTVKGIQGKQLHKILIAIPPVEEQKKIIEILSSVDEKIDSYTKEKERLQKLKKGLMQQLLTGKMRVIV
jgi:type I restriction enzyme, S subunit